ncbi:MAG: carboxypeptidase regulatory-like domain-containing protein [Clostridia bacterium]|nr:carboxypeptidase regulatory-like domain-containing protein [Clostridia bacterium]
MREKSFEEYLNEMKAMIKAKPVVQNEVIKEAVRELPNDGMGSLIVVVNSAEDRPLKGANVIIKDTSGEMLYNLSTDQSGKTMTVKLPAPIREESLIPEEGVRVYGLYDITVSAPNFVTENLKNVPVFDSVVSIQQLRLLWLPAANSSNTEIEDNSYTLSKQE